MAATSRNAVKRRDDLQAELSKTLGQQPVTIEDISYARLCAQLLGAHVNDRIETELAYRRAAQAGDTRVMRALELLPSSILTTGGVSPETRQDVMARIADLQGHPDGGIASRAREHAMLQEATSELAQMRDALGQYFDGVAPSARADSIADMAAGNQAAE